MSNIPSATGQPWNLERGYKSLMERPRTKRIDIPFDALKGLFEWAAHYKQEAERSRESMFASDREATRQSEIASSMQAECARYKAKAHDFRVMAGRQTERITTLEAALDRHHSRINPNSTCSIPECEDLAENTQTEAPDTEETRGKPDYQGTILPDPYLTQTEQADSTSNYQRATQTEETPDD